MNRVARARAALQAAEQQQGLTSTTLVSPDLPPLALVNPAPSDATALDSARSAVALVKDRAAGVGATGQNSFAVPKALEQLLPQGLPRGSVCCVEGSTTVLLALAAQVTQQEGWTAFVGTTDINFVAAQDLGMKLERVIVVPEPGGHVPEIMATLIDGMDLVVVGQQLGLTSRQQSRLTARARERGTTILVAGQWPGARLHLYGRAGQWQGANQGLGRLTTCQYRVERGSQGHRIQHADVQLHSDGLRSLNEFVPLPLPLPLRLMA